MKKYTLSLSITKKNWNQKIVEARQTTTFLLIFAMLFSSIIIAQDTKSKKEILKSTNINNLQQLKSNYAKKHTDLKNEANKIAKIKGWELTKTGDNDNYMELMKISSNGRPMYYTTYNAGAAATTKANTLSTGGGLGLNLNGEGIIFGQWDAGGIDEQHQEWDNNIIDPHLTFPHAHPTHIAGTMIAKGVDPAAKGIAPKGKIVIYGWGNDISEMAGEATNGLLLSNHSYGWFGGALELQELGRYDDQAKGYDEIQFNAPYYLVLRAAGNDRAAGYNPSKNGYDVLNGAGSSKNAMVVAAVEEVINYTGPSSVVGTWFSSMGPTDDGRIKPDISAKGLETYSTNWGGTNLYQTLSGTSMSTPNVTASLGLVQQHYNNVHGNYMRAATLKGLAIATAEEAGIAPGPDFEFGWGLLNVKKAVEAITNDGTSAVIEELHLNNGNSYSTTVNSSGGQPLVVAISWTDAAGTPVQGVDNATLMLVNDLDVRVTKNGTTYNPWILDHTNPTNAATKGDNFRDNIERINIDNATEGEYTVTVTHKGSLTNGQHFSLIIIGATEGTPPVCEATTPTGLGVNNIEESTATISWNGVTSAISYDYRYRVVGTSSWTTANTSNTATSLTGLSGATQYQVQVRSNCSDTSSSYSSTVNFTTSVVCVAQAPTNVSVFNISSNQATVSWNAAPLVSTYNYQYRLGSGSWTSGSTSNTSVVLNGLNLNSNYQVKVNSECENGDISSYSTAVNFTTTLSCNDLAPENVVVNISATSASLTWDVVPGAQNYYQVKYKPTSRSWFSLRVVFTNDVTLNSLSEGTTYDVQIIGRCGPGINTQTTELNFTTSGNSPDEGSDCDFAPENLHTTNVANNTATITWDTVDNGYASSTLYQVKYKPAGSWYRYTTSSSTEKVLIGLTPNTVYTVQIKAYCNGGSSPFANLSFTTQAASGTSSGGSGSSIDASKKYLVYPNPNKGNFIIDFTQGDEIIQSVTIYNMLGAKVFYKDHSSKLNIEQYSLKSVENGLYKIVIKTENRIEYKTVLIKL